MPKQKDLNSSLGEVIVAAYWSGKGFETISKQFGLQHYTQRKTETIHDTWPSSVNIPADVWINK